MPMERAGVRFILVTKVSLGTHSRKLCFHNKERRIIRSFSKIKFRQIDETEFQDEYSQRDVGNERERIKRFNITIDKACYLKTN